MGKTMKDIGAVFGVSDRTIGKILSGKTYRDQTNIAATGSPNLKNGTYTARSA
jgi:hypothetical protein